MCDPKTPPEAAGMRDVSVKTTVEFSSNAGATLSGVEKFQCA
jgi:hypothetical protein